jgi:hypothetical protein
VRHISTNPWVHPSVYRREILNEFNKLSLHPQV